MTDTSSAVKPQTVANPSPAPKPTESPANPATSTSTPTIAAQNKTPLPQQSTPTGNLDAKAIENLNAVCDAVKNQVISWGPKAKWKIDLLLLPDVVDPESVASPSKSDASNSKSKPDVDKNLNTISTVEGALTTGKSVDISLQAKSRTDSEDTLLKLDGDEARKRLSDRVRRLESLIMSQRREMTDKLEAANLRAEKAAGEARVLTRHLQCQERDLLARHEVERRLRDAEVRVLAKKFRSLVGARRFAAASDDDEDSEEERRNRDVETRVAQAERQYSRERHALRKKLRQSETRSAQKEIELDQAREQVTAYMNYAQQLQTHAAQQHHLAQQQHQQHLHADTLTPSNAQASGSNWASGAFGERQRVRSGLDDLLAAAAEAENAEGARTSSLLSSQSKPEAGKTAAAGSRSVAKNFDAPVNQSKPHAVHAANEHLSAAAALSRKETKRRADRVLESPISKRPFDPASAMLSLPQGDSSSSRAFEASSHPTVTDDVVDGTQPSTQTPPPTPPPKRKKTRSPYLKWNDEEDALLRAAVQGNGTRNWELITKSVPGRTYHQCRQRWAKVLRFMDHGLMEGDDEAADGLSSPATTPPPADIENASAESASTSAKPAAEAGSA